MKNVIVIHEIDNSDNDRSVIGVATSREKALEIIDKYYGKGKYVIKNIEDIRENNVDFMCNVEVGGVFGSYYSIWGEYFCIDSI